MTILNLLLFVITLVIVNISFIQGFHSTSIFSRSLLSTNKSITKGNQFAMASTSTSTVKPAVTDATASSEEELKEAISYFLPYAATSFIRAEGGVNNKVYYVVGPNENEKYVMRIYNNGFNSPRVYYEHEVLGLLADKKFSFEVPKLLPTLKGETRAVLQNGAEACLFKCIPGGPAKLSAAYSIGYATAELVKGMENIRATLPLPNPLYRNIYEAHHKITRKVFFEQLETPAFDQIRQSTDYIISELLRAEALIETILKKENPLPEQQIHADLHFLNVLVENDKVTGLLDFEFSAYDWRVMELAVGLSKYVGMADIEPVFESWVKGYREAGGKLRHDEIELVPDMIILRILSNVVYFVGRAVANEDSIEALTTRQDMYADRIRWIHSRREWMIKVLTENLSESK